MNSALNLIMLLVHREVEGAESKGTKVEGDTDGGAVAKEWPSGIVECEALDDEHAIGVADGIESRGGDVGKDKRAVGFRGQGCRHCCLATCGVEDG